MSILFFGISIVVTFAVVTGGEEGRRMEEQKFCPKLSKDTKVKNMMKLCRLTFTKFARKLLST